MSEQDRLRKLDITSEVKTAIKEDRRLNAIFAAGEIWGISSKFTVEEFQAAASSGGLTDDYRKVIEAVAEFRRRVMERR